MRKLVIAAMILSAVTPVAASELETAFAAASQAAKDAQPVRELRLESQGQGWRLFPNPNPPGSELTINVKVGEKVRLRLTLLPWGRGFPEASFDVDGIDATVDGEPTKGIHVWLRSAPAETVVEFTAQKEGLYPIYENYSRRGGRAGMIVIRKR